MSMIFRVICYLFFSLIQSLFASKNKFSIIIIIIIHVVFYYIFPRRFLEVSKPSIKSFSQKNFLKFIFTHFVLIGWNLVPPSSLSKTKIQFLHKFIYFYFLMFSNLVCFLTITLRLPLKYAFNFFFSIFEFGVFHLNLRFNYANSFYIFKTTHFILIA